MPEPVEPDVGQTRRLAATFFKRVKDDSTEESQKAEIHDLTDSEKPIISEFEEIVSKITGINLTEAPWKETNPKLDRKASQSYRLGDHCFQSYFYLEDEPLFELKSLREHQSFRDFEAAHKLELVLDIWHDPPSSAPPSSALRPFRLAFFDMDSTLINEEVIDELARSIGVYDQVSAITHRAMSDPTFDFATSLKARVALLKGVPADIWITLQKQITIATGAKELIAGLKAHGVVTGVISGGFTPMAEWLKGELGLDLAFANHLYISPSTAEYDYAHLTGELDLSDGKVIVTPKYKKERLMREASERGIDLQYTLAAGDGSNDLRMLNAAGLGIAWNAKPKTQELAPMRLNGKSLAELLFLLGPSKSLGD